MTPKQNMLETIRWGNPEYVPLSSLASAAVGMPIINMIEQPLRQSGYDGFGVYWHVTPEGSISDSSHFMFEDIADWKEHVKFPDLDAIDFQAISQMELANIDREQKLVCAMGLTGIFERMVAFMGFENTLCALVEDPEGCMEFFEAVTEFRIRLINKLIDAYDPDIYIYFDDVATANSLFMSPETYRKVIKPFHKKIVEAVTSRGVIFEMHVCGKCEELLEDYIEIGATMWHSAQTMNDLPGILKRCRGRLIVEGGWDTSGPCSYNDSTEEQVRAEVRRCISEYGQNGGFILTPVLMNERGNSLIVGDKRLEYVRDEWEKCVHVK